MTRRIDLTLFSDASVSPHKGVSGWGCWLKGNGRGSSHFGGPFKAHTSNVLEAELKAMANGLSHASLSDYFRDDDAVIMLQTDSSKALDILLAHLDGATVSNHADSARISRRRRPITDGQTDAVARIQEVLSRHELTPVLRHVRGHRSGGGRNWVNRLCDKLAKDGARAMQKLKTAQELQVTP